MLKTDDGAGIPAACTGIATPTPAGLQVRSSPLFGSGDECHARPNNVQAVCIGKVDANFVACEAKALERAFLYPRRAIGYARWRE